MAFSQYLTALQNRLALSMVGSLGPSLGLMLRARVRDYPDLARIVEGLQRLLDYTTSRRKTNGISKKGSFSIILWKHQVNLFPR